MRQYSQIELISRMTDLGFKWPQHHLIGVRNKMDTPDAYDDLFYWIQDGVLTRVYTGTTNPGSFYLQNFINKMFKGTAIMASNQQLLDGFEKGEHSGRPCWRQAKPMKIFRDDDKDLKSEEIGTAYIGMYGIHIHAMFKGPKSMRIFNWSAACQGMNDPAQWNEFIELSYGKLDRFLTYTLLSEF